MLSSLKQYSFLFCNKKWTGIIGELTRDYLDKVSQKVKEHASDVNAKLLEVMHKNIAAELRHWDAKPPVPSKSFQNICK